MENQFAAVHEIYTEVVNVMKEIENQGN